MARRVFFSFHYSHDVWRANQVRNANVVLGADDAGFFDHSEYEDARQGGAAAIKRMILRHLEGTSVTVVLIGTYTSTRPWVQFEIAESIKRDNGLLGISINHLKAPPFWLDSPPGNIPSVPASVELPAYIWDPQNLSAFATLIEEAGKRGDELKRQKAEAQKRAIRALGGLPSVPTTRVTPPPSWFELLKPRPPAPPSPISEAFLRALRDKKPKP